VINDEQICNFAKICLLKPKFSLGSVLSGQIISAGGGLASQIASRVEDLEKAAGGEAAG